jgi:hypothetical protein
MATDVTRYPTGDAEISTYAKGDNGGLGGGAATYAYVDEVSADDTMFNYAAGPNDNSDSTTLFSFSAVSVPTGVTINYVRVYFRTKHIDNYYSTYATSGPYLKVGGNYYTGNRYADSSWTTRSQDWTTNPKTGVAWTVSDVNGSGSDALTYFGNIMGYRWNIDVKNPLDSRGAISQKYLVINYSVAAYSVGSDGGSIKQTISSWGGVI